MQTNAEHRQFWPNCEYGEAAREPAIVWLYLLRRETCAFLCSQLDDCWDFSDPGKFQQFQMEIAPVGQFRR